MKVLKQLLDFYINSSIHVALAVYALSWITLKKLNINGDETILYFNFFATITGYNFVKYFGIAKWHHRSLANWLKVIQVFSLVCFGLMCYYALQLQNNSLMLITGFGMVTFLYAIPFLPKKWYLDTQQNLRDISGLKVYVIALVWCGVTVILPVFNNNGMFSQDAIITIIQNFILVIALMLPFEIRDLNYDSLKLATIPQKIGVKNTKRLGYILVLLFYFVEYFKDNIDATGLLFQCVISIILCVFIYFANEDRNAYYTSFWVEALPVIWMLLMLL
ncbi:UbiA prenyltransferase family protein [Olleya marilimosa]|uniref:membrane protein n=1 Tax=Olleya marilimosa TaxID=272164 RepID=UPI000486C4D4|nr:membrane protein [Olleya marilimosa]